MIRLAIIIVSGVITLISSIYTIYTYKHKPCFYIYPIFHILMCLITIFCEDLEIALILNVFNILIMVMCICISLILNIIRISKYRHKKCPTRHKNE